MYIPISLVQHDNACFDLLTSVIAAEGLAPTSCRSFEGFSSVRASATPYTGGSSLNPSRDILAMYAELPRVTEADEREGAVFVHVADEALVANGEVRPVPGFPGCQATAGSVYFDFRTPARVEFIFLDENILEVARGCLESPATKNEGRFSLRRAGPEEEGAAKPVGSGLAEALEALFTAEERQTAARESAALERLAGASLGMRLVQHRQDVAAAARRNEEKNSRITAFVDWIRNRGGHDPAKIAKIEKALQAELHTPSPAFACSRAPFEASPVYRALTEGFLAQAGHAAEAGWVWSDNACRADFCERFCLECAVPVLGKMFPDQPAYAQKAEWEIGQIVLRFRNPNTHYVADETFTTQFAKSLWAVMYSEGRTDRILESVTRHQGRESAWLDLALFGGLTGYARFPYKQVGRLSFEPVPAEAPSPRREPVREAPSPKAKSGSRKSVAAKKPSAGEKGSRRRKKAANTPQDDLPLFVAQPSDRT